MSSPSTSDPLLLRPRSRRVRSTRLVRARSPFVLWVLRFVLLLSFHSLRWLDPFTSSSINHHLQYRLQWEVEGGGGSVKFRRVLQFPFRLSFPVSSSLHYSFSHQTHIATSIPNSYSSRFVLASSLFLSSSLSFSSRASSVSFSLSFRSG